MPRASFMAAGGWLTSIEDHRQLTRAIFGPGSGVLTTSDFVPTPVVGELAIALTPGYIVMEGNDDTAQGSYLFWEHESVSVAAVAPGVTARVDSLLAVVADEQYGTLIGEPGARFVWATGTPAASPVALSDSEIESSWAEPGAWYRIADIRVDPGTTEFESSDITPASDLLVVAAPGEVVYQSFATVAQAIANNTATSVTLTAPDINKVDGWDAAQPTRFTPKVAGYYRIDGHLSLAANGTGARYAELTKNAATIRGSAGTAPPTLAITCVIYVSTVIYMNGTTDYVQASLYQTSGGSLNTVVSSTSYQPSLTAYYMGP